MSCEQKEEVLEEFDWNKEDICENARKAVDLLTERAGSLPPGEREEIHRKQVKLCEEHWAFLAPGAEDDESTWEDPDDTKDRLATLRDDLLKAGILVEWTAILLLSREGLGEYRKEQIDEEGDIPNEDIARRWAGSEFSQEMKFKEVILDRPDTSLKVAVLAHGLCREQVAENIAQLAKDWPGINPVAPLSAAHWPGKAEVRLAEPVRRWAPPPPDDPPAVEVVFIEDRRQPNIAIETAPGPQIGHAYVGAAIADVLHMRGLPNTTIIEKGDPDPRPDLPEPPDAEIVDKRTKPAPTAPGPIVKPWPPLSVTLRAKTLATALKRAAAVVGKKTTHTILSHCLFWVLPDGGIKICATDYDVYLQVHLSVDHVGAGDTLGWCCVRPKELLAVLPKDGEVTLSSSGAGSVGTLTLKAGTLSTTVEAISGDDFPLEPDTGTVVAGFWKEEAESLVSSLVRLRPCTSEELPRRSHICGVLIERQEDCLRTAATNGKFLAAMSEPMCSLGDADPWQTTIPNRTVDVLIAQIKLDGEKGLPPRRFSAFRNREKDAPKDITRVSFEGDGWRLSSRVVEEKFPEIDRVIPAYGGDRWNLCRDRDGLVKALAPLIKATSKSRTDYCLTRPDGDAWRWTAKTGDSQEVSLAIPVEWQGEPPMPPEPTLTPGMKDAEIKIEKEKYESAVRERGHIGFSVKKMETSLMVMPNGQVRLTFSDRAYGPLLIQPEGNEWPKVVLMPVR